MIIENVAKFTNVAVKKSNLLNTNSLKYFWLSMLAGMYVGFGIVLVFTLGAPLKISGVGLTKVVMGASFGVALTLVIFAGSELFTGNNMVMVIGSLNKSVSWWQTLKLWIVCYFGNMAGALLLAILVIQSGLVNSNLLIASVSKAKMVAPFWELFFRGILCNILVCLAIWTSASVKNEVAKMILIFWTLFAFFGSGFEHSIANMSLLALGIFQKGSTLSWNGYIFNLIPVTLGNIVGGGLFVGAGYWFVANNKKRGTSNGI